MVREPPTGETANRRQWVRQGYLRQQRVWTNASVWLTKGGLSPSGQRPRGPPSPSPQAPDHPAATNLDMRQGGVSRLPNKEGFDATSYVSDLNLM